MRTIFRFGLPGGAALLFLRYAKVALLIRQLPGLYLVSVLAQAAALAGSSW